MKTLSLMLLLVSSISHAVVVKPATAGRPASDKAQINGVAFNYWVEDRGWNASSKVGSGVIEAYKGFLFNFEPAVAMKIDSKVATALGVEASEKCTELGQLELIGQAKDVPDMKTSVKSVILNTVVSESDDAFYARFVCSVTVTASK